MNPDWQGLWIFLSVFCMFIAAPIGTKSRPEWRHLLADACVFAVAVSVFVEAVS